MDKQPVVERDMDAYLEAVNQVAFDNCIKRLAGDIGMSAKALYKRLDDNDAMPLRLVDFVGIFWSVDRDSQKQMIQPFLRHLNMIAVDRVDAGEVVKQDVFGSVLDKQYENGRLAQLIHQAVEDGEVDGDEAELLEEQFKLIESATARLKAQLCALRKPSLKAVNQ